MLFDSNVLYMFVFSSRYYHWLHLFGLLLLSISRVHGHRRRRRHLCVRKLDTISASVLHFSLWIAATLCYFNVNYNCVLCAFGPFCTLSQFIGIHFNSSFVSVVCFPRFYLSINLISILFFFSHCVHVQKN